MYHLQLYLALILLVNLIDCQVDQNCTDKWNIEEIKANNITIYKFQEQIDDFFIEDLGQNYKVTLLAPPYSYDLYSPISTEYKGPSSDLNVSLCLPVDQISQKNGAKTLFYLEKKNNFIHCAINPLASGENKCVHFYLEGSKYQRKEFNFTSGIDLEHCQPINLMNKQILLVCEPKRNKLTNLTVPYITRLSVELESNDTELLKINDQLMLDSNRLLSEGLEIDLIYSYNNLNSIFVLKRQKKKAEKLMRSILGQICLPNDQIANNCYTEISLSCTDPNTNENYTYAQRAFFYLDEINTSSASRSKLFVAFNSYNEKVDQSKGTIICSFPFGAYNSIVNSFTRTINDCYSGSQNGTSRLLNYYFWKGKKISSQKNCKSTVPKNFSNCPSGNENQFIESTVDIKGDFVKKIETSKLVTSLGAYTRIDLCTMRFYTFIDVSTEEGKIHRLQFVFDNFYKGEIIDLTRMMKLHNLTALDSKVLVRNGEIFYTSKNLFIKHLFDQEIVSTSDQKNYLIVILIASMILTIFFIFSIIYYTKMREKKIRMLFENRQSADYLAFINQAKELLIENNILIDSDCLEMLDMIGNGFFGCVYRGLLKISSRPTLVEVAVKTLNNLYNDKIELKRATKSLIDEALVMKEFEHKNVIVLLGVCLEEGSLPKIVILFMRKGSLLDYIRLEKNIIKMIDLIRFAMDVAEGMDYLSENEIVHRDLAARNCLIDDDLNVKIADFGLTRDIYQANYYVCQSQGCLPIRWMAPESIEKMITTTKSDVWSYGVLLWELFTRGNHPYCAIEDSKILHYLKAGERLPKPRQCTVKIYELMLDCFHYEQGKRPAFNEIFQRIRALIDENEEDNVPMSMNIMVNYENYPVSKYYTIEETHTQLLNNDLPVTMIPQETDDHFDTNSQLNLISN